MTYLLRQKARRALILIFLSVSFSGISQQFDWARNIGDGKSLEIPKSSCIDPSGNFISCGYFQAATDFDPGPATFTLLNQPYYSGFVHKLDPNGHFVWARHFDSDNGSSSCDAIATDKEGAVYVTGVFYGTTDFDPTPGVFTITSTGSLYGDMFICKLDKNGSFRWVRPIRGVDYEVPHKLVYDSINNALYITGTFAGKPDFDPGPGTTTLDISQGAGYLLKLDTAGTLIWCGNFGGNNNTDAGNSLVIDNSGSIYVTGEAYGSSLDFGLSSSTYPVANWGGDAFIAKYSSSGNIIWAYVIGSNDIETSSSIAILNNKIYLTGSFTGSADFDVTGGVFNLTSSNPSDFDTYIACYDLNASLQWAKRVAGFSDDVGRDIEITKTGQVVVAGTYSGSIDIDPGPATVFLPYSGHADIFITTLDTNGTYLWGGGAGASGVDFPRTISIDKFDNIYIAGNYMYDVDFDIAASTYTMNAGGFFNETTFVVKYSAPCQAPPPPSAPQGTLNICSGAGAKLNATSVGYVLWYSTNSSSVSVFSGQNVATPTLSIGSYTWYAESITCKKSLQRTVVTVSVHPNPTISIMSNPNVICSGESATITSIGAATFTWSTGQNSNSMVAAPPLTTVYTVAGASGPSCTATSTFSLVVEDCTQSENFDQKESFKIYPVPTSDIITIDSVQEGMLHLLDISGRLVIIEKIKDKTIIDVSFLKPGIYVAQIFSGENLFNRKIVVSP